MAMKIYTKTGDDGSTGLFGGARVRKSDPRLDCYGTLDELNAALGLAASNCMPEELIDPIRAVQNDLFVLGAHLATVAQSRHAAQLPPLDEAMASRLEMQIDSAECRLEPLRQFIIPGGVESAARLHLARTICRRAERLIVAFAEDRPVDQLILTYLNRLSDWLFVQARLCNRLAEVADIPWEKPSVVVGAASHARDI